MRTLEFDTTMANDSSLKVPAAVVGQIRKDGKVHVIVLLRTMKTRNGSAWQPSSSSQATTSLMPSYDSI
ncbi:MAG: hypothetical protein JO307_22100 [Bryobacterales bacterium]|nr:hypothetical protein [Bryobacterales bacterium]MBV9397796.1 hypothetical protein [Bryobacterales bacterium]